MSYGAGSAETINSSSSVLRELYPNESFNTHIMGSPFIEKAYLSQSENTLRGRKVVFVLPGVMSRNAYFIGYDREFEFFNFQECISPILDLLHRFSARFNIVVKDYPAGFHKELFNGGYDGLDYVSSEVPYAECIADAGAIILPWVSTSFIEGIMTNANICLYDPSNMNQESKKVLAEACALFEVDLNLFLPNLKSVCPMLMEREVFFLLITHHYGTIF